MLVPVERLLDVPILSLQTGVELARTSDVIIDPRKLKIVAFVVTGNKLDHTKSVLHPEDIREISDIGMIVDSSDRLMSTEGLVRLQEVIDFSFTLPNIKVEDDQSHKLGSVKGYSVDPDSFFIQQLYIKPPIIRSLRVTTFTVHRSQIISVNNAKIIVKAPTVKEQKTTLQETVQTAFVNPFRSSPPAQPEGKDLD